MMPYICNGNVMDKTLRPNILVSDCIDCVTTEELNGIYEIKMSVPFDSEYANLLTVGAYIYAKPNPLSSCQFFRIYKTTITLNGKLVAYGEHIRYILNHYPCPMVFGNNISNLITAINNNITYTNIPFKLFTNKTTPIAMQIANVQSIGSIMLNNENSLLDVYGGEWEFDNYTCMLWFERGSNKNIVLQYGYDISDCERNCELIQGYTHIFPYYEWALHNGDIATITLSHKSLESKYPAILDRDLIQIDNSYTNSDVMRIYSINLAEVYKLDLTVGYLDTLNIRSMAEYWLDEHKAELLGYSISTTINAECIKDNVVLESCKIGDTIRVRVPIMNIETKAKIIKAEYDCINESYISLDIGTLKSTFADIIANNSQDIKRNNRNMILRTTQIINSNTTT